MLPFADKSLLIILEKQALNEPLHLLDEARYWRDDLLSSLLIKKKVGQQEQLILIRGI